MGPNVRPCSTTMNVSAFAQAIQRASRGKDDAGLLRLGESVAALLKKHKRESMLPAIIEEVEKIMRARSAAHEATLAIADESVRTTDAAAIDEDVRTLDAAHLPIRTYVDPTLVAGYDLRARGKRIDRSKKRALLALYDTLIS